MATQFIDISGNASRTAGKTRAFIDSLNRVRNDYGDNKDVIDQIASGGDWTALAAAIGTSEADAQVVYNLMGSINAELNGASIVQLCSRCG